MPHPVLKSVAPLRPDCPRRKITQSNYRYSDEITIREWNGGRIWVQVGYEKDHPQDYRIILYKEYAHQIGQRTDKYIIKDAADWFAIKAAVDRLWPALAEGEPSAELIDKAISQVTRDTQLLDLVAKYPDLLDGIPDNIDILTLPQEKRDALFRFLSAGGTVAQKVIERLSNEKVEDLEGFGRILEELRLSTVNSLVNHVTSRLGFIKAFETVIHDNRSYERRGKNSVHNLLRENIWMLDRNYTILHDDQTLKQIIYQSFDKSVSNPVDGDTRPDFLCMTGRREPDKPIRELVIIEIKRP